MWFWSPPFPTERLGRANQGEPWRTLGTQIQPPWRIQIHRILGVTHHVPRSYKPTRLHISGDDPDDPDSCLPSQEASLGSLCPPFPESHYRFHLGSLSHHTSNHDGTQTQTQTGIRISCNANPLTMKTAKPKPKREKKKRNQPSLGVAGRRMPLPHHPLPQPPVTPSLPPLVHPSSASIRNSHARISINQSINPFHPQCE